MMHPDERMASMDDETWMAFRIQWLRYASRLNVKDSQLAFPPSTTRDE